MKEIDFAQQMLAKAANDLLSLRGMFVPHGDGENYFKDDIFGFHAQQAAEKVLKAWIAAIDVQFPRTHNLDALLKILQTNGQAVEGYREIIDLNRFAVVFRYDLLPDDSPSLDRTRWLGLVQTLFDHVDGLIGNLLKAKTKV
jgi:hypothetical protein